MTANRCVNDEPTLLAKYRAKHQTPVAALARDFGVNRNIIYHLLDPSDERYERNRPSDELIRKLAARVGSSAKAVREDLQRFTATRRRRAA